MSTKEIPVDKRGFLCVDYGWRPGLSLWRCLCCDSHSQHAPGSKPFCPWIMCEQHDASQSQDAEIRARVTIQVAASSEQYRVPSNAYNDTVILRAPKGLVITREMLGMWIRDGWVAWAQEQPNPQPSWVKPWSELGEGMKEVDRRMGELVVARLKAFGVIKEASSNGE